MLGDRDKSGQPTTAVRERLTPDCLTRTFNALVEESSLPPVRLHDLRHGAATLMLLAGDELKTIADQLGHSSVVLTADTYLSVAVELGLKSAAARLKRELKAQPTGNWSHIGPTLVPPVQIKEPGVPLVSR